LVLRFRDVPKPLDDGGRELADDIPQMRRQRHEDGIDRNQKVGVQSIEFRIREYDPVATQVDARLLSFGKDSEHVHVPLSEFVDPVRNVIKCLRIHDDVVEPFLKREINKYAQNKRKRRRALTINRA
jgi:hypothetical protein